MVELEAYVKTVRGDISDGRLQEIIVKMRFLDSYATSFFREQAVRILVESTQQHGTAYSRFRSLD